MKRLLLLVLWVQIGFLAQANTPYTIVLADDKSDVNAAIDKKEYFGYLTLQNTSDTVLNLTDIELTPFVETASGKQAAGEISLNGKNDLTSFAVDPGKTVRLEVRSTFPEEGKYQAVFSMYAVSGKQKTLITKKFLVTYAKAVRSKQGRKKPFYQVKSIHTAEGILGNLSVQMILEDSSGQGGKITQIEPVIWRMGEGTELKSTDYGPIVVSRDSTVLRGPLNFDGTKFQTLNLDLSQICQPGRYKGEVFLSSDGADSVTAEFTVTARRSGLYALIFITLGLVSAYLLRLILTVLQPKLKNKQKIALMIRQARSFKDLQGEEASVLSGYTRQLSQLLSQLDSGTPADFAAQIEMLEFKEKLFREWVQARRRVNALRPASLQTTLLPVLLQAEEFIANTTSDLETGNPLLSALRKIPVDIRKLVRDHVVEESTELANLAERELKAAGVDAPDIDKLKSDAEAIKELPANSDADLAALKVAFTKVQDRYSSLLIAEMKEQLAQFKSSPPPLDISGKDWLDITAAPIKAIEQADRESDISGRIRHFNEAMRLFLQGITQRMEVYKEALIQKKKYHQPDMSESVIDAAKQAWQSGKDLLAKWGDMELDEALAASGEVMSRAMTMWYPPAVTRGPESLGNPSLENRAIVSANVADSPGVFFRRTRLPASTDFNLEDTHLGTLENNDDLLKKLKRYILWSDLVSSLLIFAVSAILGLLILWAPNSTWGSFTDILYAVSWGFGIHTATKPPDVSGDIGKFVRKKLVE